MSMDALYKHNLMKQLTCINVGWFTAFDDNSTLHQYPVTGLSEKSGAVEFLGA